MNWKFYILKFKIDSKIYIFASHELGGFRFENGIPIIRTVAGMFSERYVKTHEEISLLEALVYIPIHRQQSFAKILDIELPKPEPVDDKTKTFIIEYLKEKRAFNGDSAHYIKENTIKLNHLYVLLKEGILGQIKNRFYIKNVS